MSKKVDDRVVEMRFDNRDFEKNVKTSMSTLEKLKEALKFKGVKDGLESVSTAAKKVDFSGMSNGIETVNARFSAMQVVAMTALSNITSAAMNAGKQLVSALTIDPVLDGFREYETQMGAIQTILANTESKGTTLNQVNAALDELNAYADQTIYNFTEMTKNIGTFTAAGVDLETSVTSIKGIANLAAISGSTSAQASQAMYQLSQALAAGRVSLMDWNSVVNAGMGGEVFQNALKRTAENMGYNVDALIEKYGSFRESLTEGQWLTTDVLTETLTQLSGAYTESDLLAKGYTKEQAQEILKLAETGLDAATKVKTFTQLIDTLKEALGSGWTKTWQLIIGDFEEAKELWTGISDVLSNMINASADARNALLSEGLGSGWDQLLDLGIGNEDYFKEVMTATAKSHGVAIDEMIEKNGSFEKSLKEGWVTTDILAESIDNAAKKTEGLSVEQLKAMGYTREQAEALQELNAKIKNGSVNLDEYVEKMNRLSGRENIIEGLKNVFITLGEAIKPIGEAFREIFPAMTGDQLYSFTEKFRELTETFKLSDTTIANIKSTFKGFFALLDIGRMALSPILTAVGSLIGLTGQVGGGLLGITGALGDFIVSIRDTIKESGAFAAIGEFIKGVFSGISEIIESVTGKISGLGDVFSAIGGVISKVVGTIFDGIKSAFSWITENVSLGDIFAGAGAVGLFSIAKTIADVVDQIRDSLSKLPFIGGLFGGQKSESIVDNFKAILGGLQESLQAFTSSVKATTLLQIAAAIGILTLSIAKLSEIEPAALTYSLGAMAAMMTMLNLSFRSITKSLTKFDSKGIVKSGIALIAMAKAIDIFANAMVTVSELDMDAIGRGLVALGGGLAELVIGLKILNGVKINLRTSVAMLAIAEACKILGDALGKFSGMSWDEIGRGLSGMGGALAEVTAALAILSKVGGGGALLGSASIFVAVQSLSGMAESLKSFSGLSWDEIGRGLSGMGGALAELTIALGALSKIGGFGAILGGGAILIAVQSLDEISENLKKMGTMSWEEIGRGLTAMGAALLEVGGMAGALGKIAGFSGILGAGTILMVVQGLEQLANGLQKFGTMSWDEIGRGLTAMGGALAETGLAAGLTGLAGLSGIIGSGSILIVIQGLEQLANGLQKFGTMSWDEIGRGLTAMAGALGVTGLASALTGFAGLAGILGGGTINLTVQSLGQLADALQKFGSMNWDEIGRGLTAMGAAMGETALGGLLNTFSGFGAGAIAEVAGPLGTLADSVKKWTTISVPEGFGAMLGEIGSGVLNFNFAGWGADAIAAVAEPLGQLADSVKKWTGVVVPEGLGDQLKTLAPGIEAFNFAGWGGDAIATVAEPLGILADSIKKWSQVTVPEGLGDQLKTLAPGIEAFNFSGWGADAIAKVVEPLGGLADSVKKWVDVTVPEGMQANLEGLAAGVKAFNFSGWGASDMGSVVEPLGNLAGAIKKWENIVIPEGMQSGLKGLAEGVKAFDLGWFEGVDLDDFIDPMSRLGDILPKFSGITISSTLGENLKSLGEGIKSLEGKDPGDISGVCDAIEDLAASAEDILSINMSAVTSQLTSFTDAINNVSVSGDNFAKFGSDMVNGFVDALTAGVGSVQTAAQSLANAAVNSFVLAASIGGARSSAAGIAMINGLANGMRSGLGTLQSTVGSIVNSVNTMITGKSTVFQASGSSLVTKLASGIASGKPLVTSAITSALSSASASIRSHYASFYSAGSYISQGLASGMRSQLGSVRSAASQMASLAAQAVRAAARINSPSRVFMEIGEYMGEGMVVGLESYQRTAYKTAYAVGDSAASGVNLAINKMNRLLDSGMDLNPTITPVLDLSNVQNGVGAIDNMFGGMAPLNILGEVGSINRVMNARLQNGVNDDVVSAIDKLYRKLDDMPVNQYNVNGITYDDGSNIARTVGDLTRQLRIERRS